MSMEVKPYECICLELKDEFKSEIVKKIFNVEEAVRWCRRMNILMAREGFDAIYFLRHNGIVSLHPW